MKRLWIVLAIVVTFGFTVLGWIGSRIYQEMPPIPERIVASDGRVVAPEGAIRSGQAVWQTLVGWRSAQSGATVAMWLPIGLPTGSIASAS
jgi:nitric oxide reductase subunit B